MTFRAAPLKRIASLNPETLSEATDPDFKFDYIDIGSVGRGQLVETPTPTRFGDAPSRARRFVREGDTIVSSVRTYLRAVLPVRGFADKTVVSTGFVVCRPGVGIDPDFLSWALQADSFIEEVVARSVGVSYPAINPSEVGRILVPLPDHPTQRRVADFLDRETTRIDELIQAKREMGARLEEKRLALIDDAIAAGSWPVVPLRRIADVMPSPVDKKSREGEEEIRLCNYTDVYYHDLITADLDFMTATAPAGQIRRFALRSGDTIITKDSESWTDIGVPAFVPEAMAGVLCGYHLAVLRPIHHGLHPEYLYWATRSPFVQSQFHGAARGVTRFGMRTGEIRAIGIPLPPSQEQKRIVRSLNLRTAAGAETIHALGTSIRLLQERRQALITAAVTGQLDITEDGAYEELEKATA